MEEAHVCNDPQFVNALENCVRREIDKTNASFSGVKNETKALKLRVHTKLLERKALKKNSEILHKSVLDLTAKITSKKKYLADMSLKAELVKLGLDDKSKATEIDREYYKNIMMETKKTWELYHERYEKFPLAKSKKQEWIKLEKIRIEQKVLETKIVECEKTLLKQKYITWLKVRVKIVLLARLMITNMKKQKKLLDLKNRVNDRLNELKEKQAEREIAKKKQVEEKKKQEEKKRKRERELLEMPPPTIDYNRLRAMSKQPPFLENWQEKCSTSEDWDTLSVDTLMLEEICRDSSREAETSFVGSVQSDQMSYREQIDASNVSADQKKNQIAEQDTMSEEDCGSIEKEVEYQVDRESESSDRRSEHNLTEQDDPVSKKMRLIFGEAEGSVVLSERSEKRKSAVPTITNIKVIDCDVSQLKTIERMDAMSDMSKRFIDQSDISSLVDVPAMRDLEAENSLSTCDHPFDYADVSNISFSSDIHKADQLSLEGPLLSDLCENSRISMRSENVEPVAAKHSAQPSTSKNNFLQFDFMNITKPSGGNLF